MENEQPVQRLCSEIQLFDLCDLDACRHRSGRFCTKADLLARFEAIAEEDERSPDRYLVEGAEEGAEGEEGEDSGYEDGLSGGEYEEEEL